MKKPNSKLPIFLAVLYIFIIGLFIGCSSNGNKIAEELTGKWKRLDGPYTIEINEILPKGEMFASYYNPNPIKVGKASWREQNGNILVYVELRDKNYPGSIYRLTYDKNNKTLNGSYFQAVTKETFEVGFTREE